MALEYLNDHSEAKLFSLNAVLYCVPMICNTVILEFG